MIRLYLDEDSSDTDLLKALRLRRVDVIVPAEAAMLGKSDAEQLTWATVEGRVLYSANRGDFYNIHSEWMRQQRTHAGIVLGAQQRYSVGEQMRRLLCLMNALTAEEMQNRIEFLSAWSRGPNQ